MGTDIHIEVVVKSAKGTFVRAAPPPVWLWEESDFLSDYTSYVTKAAWPSLRSYSVFAKFADGVRGEYGSGPEPRGLPEWIMNVRLDRGGLVKQDPDWKIPMPLDMNLGDHTHSWLTAREFLETDWRERDEDGRVYLQWPALLLEPYIETISGIFGEENVFLVFGFDS